MKWWITTLLSALAICVSIVIFFLSNDNSDIVYTVSDNIPLNIDEEDTKSNIQQIEVKNLGDKAAKDIQIKINGQIIESRIIKDSENDKVETFPDSYELVYSELPPQGNFKLIVESSLNDLTEDVLTIKSDDGIARNGLEDKNSTSYLNAFLSILVILSYFLFVLISLKDFKKNAIVRQMALKPHRDISEVYGMKKPIYFNTKEWGYLLYKFFEEKIREDLLNFYNTSPMKLNSYYILKNKQPEYLTEEEWNKLKESAKNTFIIKIDYSFIESISDDSLILFLSGVFETGDNIPKALKLEISEKISKNYINYKKNNGFITTSFITTEEIRKELNKQKPIFVSEGDWERYEKYLSELQFMYTLIDIYKSYNEPLEVVKVYNGVHDNQKEKLEEIAYNIEFYRFALNSLNKLRSSNGEIDSMPKWMKEKDYQQIKYISDFIVSIYKKESDFNENLRVLNKVFIYQELPEDKLESMDDTSWNTLKRYIEKEKDLTKLNKDIAMREDSLISRESIASDLQNKLERQLYIINELFRDTSVLERIETYSNPFEKGNLENLKKIAKHLNDINQGK